MLTVPGRRLLEDHEIDFRYRPFDPVSMRRRQVLRETIAKFEAADPPDLYLRQSLANLQRWQAEASSDSGIPRNICTVKVLKGDWGVVTLALTKQYGQCFAVLNMANAYVPGGAYVEGAAAQEENIFRRTDCHFRIGPDEYDAVRDRYVESMTALISGDDGRVYLDTDHPRVCLRGPEDRSREDLGYAWLGADEVFPFYELRAAARDLRGGEAFSAADARHRIAAQLDTMIEKDVRYAVLGASGCGAFQNPAQRVAAIYQQEIERRREHFKVIAFAIFHAGYGPDNHALFVDVFGE